MRRMRGRRQWEDIWKGERERKKRSRGKKSETKMGCGVAEEGKEKINREIRSELRWSRRRRRKERKRERKRELIENHMVGDII